MRGLGLILLLYAVAGNDVRAQKAGKCPELTPDEDGQNKNCGSVEDRCETDSDCQDDGKCCSDGCVRNCATPLRTGCHQLKRQLERQPLGDGFVPECADDGSFRPVQCIPGGGCWCVDGRGFELAGTRARSLDRVNCTRPKGCAGFLCRMLCPYGFELDPEGCPLCECRNPCKKVACPAGHQCSLEDVPCADELCPPLPTCKRPRTLESQCPVGEPIVSPDTKNPFLCGMQPNKPQCPLNYVCNILRGNDYGVCCPLVDKPGHCPGANSTSEEGKCPPPCEMDTECKSSSKCCHTVDCGKVCIPPGNTTLCQQQKAVVELLVGSNPDYAAYIPQCDDTGRFLPKQCTTNGKLCWCIDEKGAQVRGTLGPGEMVSCLEEVIEARNSNNVSSCPEISCAAECPLGYKSDADGCRLCRCFEPCEEIDCPSDAECVILKEDPCVSGSCPPIATCMRHPSPGSSCKEGTSPLMDDGTGEIRKCSDDDCPSAFRCHLLPDQDVGVCCPLDKPQVNADTLLCPKVVPRPAVCPNLTCGSHLDCEGGLKCCAEPSCGSICVSARSVRLPTMCEYLRDVGHKLGSSNESLAFPVPSCRMDGSYEPVQCDGAPCWCVDEFGAELPGTRVENGEMVNCNEARSLKPCLGLLCRLGCDYGFEMDSEGCPVCECRNPCLGSKCPAGRECQMVSPQDCREGWCPAVPQCITNEVEGRAPPSCPVGRPMLYEEDDVPVTCDPGAPYQQCPVTHTCVSEENSRRGICCPRLDDEVDSSSVAAESERKPVAGQCPYLVPPASPSDTCDFECASDAECGEGRKCCSSGCGTQCTTPLLMTACQHGKYVAEHLARETGTPASRMYVPACRGTDGGFERVQCDGISSCWCVGDGGLEVPGTRSRSTTPNCTVPEACPSVTECTSECPYGFQIGEDGCPVCACNDPCQGVTCPGLRESCQVVRVSCTSRPCPPLALCLPPRENPCPTGEPLNGHRCGPTEGSQCPSSHRCHLDPLGSSQLGLCCPKPREVCRQSMRVGTCRSSQPRWFFDEEKNSCQPFLYGGCGGNLNNFHTKEECTLTCPVVTSQCERIRERNLKIRKSYNKIVYIPKCSRKTGAWEAVQCLDAVGLCWCVDPDGEQVPGSVVRGTPFCSQRGARQSAETAICPDGDSVHPCPEDLCTHVTCLAQPNATCRINPCGSCRVEFFDWRNRAVECGKGLTACLGEVDRVLRVTAWQNHHRQARSTLMRAQMTSVNLDVGEEVVEEEVEMLPDRPVTVASGMAVIIGPRLRSLLERGMAVAVVKPGICPRPSLMTVLRGLSWNCRHGCMLDAHCPGPLKCCLGSCGLECLEPVGLAATPTPAYMSVMTPNCSAEGGYAVVQRQGELSWCVDKYGNPFQETFTRGSVKCLKNGSIVERIESGPVCPENRRPVICRQQCLDSSCLQHPEAVCVADPCDGCSVRFVDSRGNEVRCEDKCHQPMVKGSSSDSSCNDAEPETRFAFSKRKCQEFLYSGCGGNDNNFPTLDDCRRECEETRPVCEQPRETGLCRAFWVRWFYNRNTHRCEKFIYGGCGGNANNFETREQCEAVCPDRVFCPWSALHEELVGCSRSQACVNSTCSGHPSSVCTVDPCTCRPVFVDTRGDPIECRGLPDLVMPEVSALTRCQHRRSQGEGVAPQCAADGTFFPTQCTFGGRGEEHCWCVDEAGNQLPDGNPQQCRFVRVKSVRVTVNLERDPTTSNDPSMAPETKLLTNRLLERLSVDRPRDLLVESTDSDTTRVTFTLMDDNKVDAAFKLEEMVKSGGLKLMLTRGSLTADYKRSHFYYVTDHVPTDVEVFANTIPDTHMALGGTTGSSIRESTTVLVAVVTATSVLTVLLLLTLVALYRRRKSSNNKDLNGRRSFVTLMFSSPLYDLITKKSQTKTNPYDAAKEKPPIPTVESEYETIQNELNSAKQPADPVPPAYDEIDQPKAP